MASYSEDANGIIIEFGKYAGRYLDALPSGYLRWMAENLDDDYLATKADEEWGWRETVGDHKHED